MSHSLLTTRNSARRTTGGQPLFAFVSTRQVYSLRTRTQHKLICTKTTTGESATSRPPALKVAEKMMTDDDIMAQVDGILIKALDLENHPENADAYAAVINCRVELTDTKRAAEHFMHIIDGREPPPIPDRVPKLFQIVRVALLSNEQVPSGLNDVAQKVRGVWQGLGHLQPGSKQLLVRVMWVSEESPWATCYSPRLIMPAMIEELAKLKKGNGKGDHTDEPMDTDRLIKRVDSFVAVSDTLITLTLHRLFDIRALTDPEWKKKLTIVRGISCNPLRPLLIPAPYTTQMVSMK